MYESVEGFPRSSVCELANDFNQKAPTTEEELRVWYENTDMYVFDLLPLGNHPRLC